MRARGQRDVQLLVEESDEFEVVDAVWVDPNRIRVGTRGERTCDQLPVGQQGDIDVAASDRVEHLEGPDLLQRDRDVGMGCAEAANGLGQEPRVDAGKASEPQRPRGHADERLHCRLEGLVPSEDAASQVDRSGAGRRRDDTAGHPAEQRNAHMALEVGDLARDGRLREHECLRGRRQRTTVGHLDENPKRPRIDHA